MASLRIWNLTLDPPMFLAPMAGLTHSAFRQILSGFGGVGLLSTEMLWAKRLPTENPMMSPYLMRTGLEKPLSYQLLVSTDTDTGPAVDKLHKLQADAVDLNMGCPVRNICNSGGGSMLMEQPENARRIVREARRGTQLPISAKIRLGAELDGKILRDFCAMLEDEGIDMLSVHARLKNEPFSRRPRWEWIAMIKEWVGIPVIANEGSKSVEEAQERAKIFFENNRF